MPTLPPVYFANWVYGRESFTAITYNASTGAWTVTPNGATRISLMTSDPEQQALMINGRFSMFVLADGSIQVGDITKNTSADPTVPRLDFMRQAGPVAKKFASITHDGIFWVFDVDEKTTPTGSDRMYLLGNSNSSVGLDGLLTPGVSEIGLLVPVNGPPPKTGSLPYLVDQSGNLMTHSTGGG